MEETLSTWIPVIALFASPFAAWLVARITVASRVRVVTAETYERLVASIDKQEVRLAAQRDEIDVQRAEMEALRVRVAALEEEARGLTERLRIMERYMRRLIGQLRAAGIKPDLPQSVLDDLFDGSGSGTGV